MRVFLFDYEHRIVNSQQIRHLWPRWGPLASSTRPVLSSRWRLTSPSAALNPWGYHAFNLAVHVLSGLLLFGIVRRMLESADLRAQYGRASRWLALAVAAIPGSSIPCKPRASRTSFSSAESLMGFFFLLTLYCGIQGLSSRHSGAWSVAAVIACGLGMGSKEVMIVAPILVLLYDRVFAAPSFGDALRKRPGLYAGLAATWLVLAASLANGPGDQEQMYLVPGINPWSYAVTQFDVIVHYLRLALWPDLLIFDYAWPIAEPLSSVLPSAVVVSALLGGTVLALIRWPWVGFWGAWFFLILAPTSSIMPIADVAFEHRRYAFRCWRQWQWSS